VIYFSYFSLSKSLKII